MLNSTSTSDTTASSPAIKLDQFKPSDSDLEASRGMHATPSLWPLVGGTAAAGLLSTKKLFENSDEFKDRVRLIKGQKEAGNLLRAKALRKQAVVKAPGMLANTVKSSLGLNKLPEKAAPDAAKAGVKSSPFDRMRGGAKTGLKDLAKSGSKTAADQAAKVGVKAVGGAAAKVGGKTVAKLAAKQASRLALMAACAEVPVIGWAIDAGLALWTAYDLLDAFGVWDGIGNWLNSAPAIDQKPELKGSSDHRGSTQFLPVFGNNDNSHDDVIRDTDVSMRKVYNESFGDLSKSTGYLNNDSDSKMWHPTEPPFTTTPALPGTYAKLDSARKIMTTAHNDAANLFSTSTEQYASKVADFLKPSLDGLNSIVTTSLPSLNSGFKTMVEGNNKLYQEFRRTNFDNRKAISGTQEGFFDWDGGKIADGSMTNATTKLQPIVDAMEGGHAAVMSVANEIPSIASLTSGAINTGLSALSSAASGPNTSGTPNTPLGTSTPGGTPSGTPESPSTPGGNSGLEDLLSKLKNGTNPMPGMGAMPTTPSPQIPGLGGGAPQAAPAGLPQNLAGKPTGLSNDDAKKLISDEAKKRAEEDAKKKAEEDAKKKAAEDAKKKALGDHLKNGPDPKKGGGLEHGKPGAVKPGLNEPGDKNTVLAPHQPPGAASKPDGQTLDINNKKVHFDDKRLAAIAKDLMDTPKGAIANIRELAAKEGFPVPPAGQDLGQVINPSQVHPGDILTDKAGKNFLCLGDGTVIDEATRAITPLKDAAQFDAGNGTASQGFFRLSAGAPETQAAPGSPTAADTGGTSPAHPAGNADPALNPAGPSHNPTGNPTQGNPPSGSETGLPKNAAGDQGAPSRPTNTVSGSNGSGPGKIDPSSYLGS